MNVGQKVLFELKKEISETDYGRYIKKLVYDTKRSRSNIVYFNAPNLLIAKWVKSKYTEKLEHLFELQNEVKPEIESIKEEVEVENIENTEEKSEETAEIEENDIEEKIYTESKDTEEESKPFSFDMFIKNKSKNDK